MKRAIVFVAALATCTCSLAAHADDKKADQKFCAAVTSYQSNVAELKAMGPHTTVAEMRAAARRLDNDVSEMKKAAGKMKTPTAKQFMGATKQLQNDVNNISDDATLQQVHAKIQADVKDAQTAGRQLASEAGCPVTAPDQDQSPSP